MAARRVFEAGFGVGAVIGSAVDVHKSSSIGAVRAADGGGDYGVDYAAAMRPVVRAKFGQSHWASGSGKRWKNSRGVAGGADAGLYGGTPGRGKLRLVRLTAIVMKGMAAKDRMAQRSRRAAGRLPSGRL